MNTCFSTTISSEINRLTQIYQTVESGTPEPSELEKCISAVACLALEGSIVLGISQGSPCCICISPLLLLDQEVTSSSETRWHNLQVNLGNREGEVIPTWGFRKTDCCKVAQVASATIKEYTKEKCCPIGDSMISSVHTV